MNKTNAYLAVIYCVCWTNLVDVALTPSGEVYRRQTIETQVHAYRLTPASPWLTNVSITTNLTRRTMVWVETAEPPSPFEFRPPPDEPSRREPPPMTNPNLRPGGTEGFPPTPLLPLKP